MRVLEAEDNFGFLATFVIASPLAGPIWSWALRESKMR